MKNKTSRRWQIKKDDVLAALVSIESNFYDAVFMDSPYGLGFMAKKWDEGLASTEVCRELLRVAKPGAMHLAFGHPRTFHRLACRLEDAGWQIRDCIIWLYGQGYPKSHNIGKAIDKKLGAKRKVVGERKQRGKKRPEGMNVGMAHSSSETELITIPATSEAALWDGYGTALKPAWEPILVAMKPREGSFANNALEWGCSGLNINETKIDGTVTTNPLVRNAKGYGSAGLVQGRTGKGIVSEGRWPANVILDEVTAELLDQKGRVSMFNLFYCPKASKRERNAGLDGLPITRPDTRSESGMGYFKEKGIQPQQNDHPCVKPLQLCQYLATLILPPAGFRQLLVPYCGSGSEMIGALMVAGTTWSASSVRPSTLRSPRGGWLHFSQIEPMGA